jgi:hypothetical protein
MIQTPIHLISLNETLLRRSDNPSVVRWMRLYDYAIERSNKSMWMREEYDNVRWVNGGIYIDNQPIRSNQRMNWKHMSNLKGYTYSDQFIQQFRSKLHLSTLLITNQIGGSAIYNIVKSIYDHNSTFKFINSDQIVNTICRYQLLSEDLLCNQVSWWNWDIVSRYQNITEGVIMRVGNFINYDLLKTNRKTSFYVKSRFIPGYTYEEEYEYKYRNKSIEDILEFDSKPDWSLMFVLNNYTYDEIKPYEERLSYHDKKTLLARHDIDLIDDIDRLFDYEFTPEIEELLEI